MVFTRVFVHIPMMIVTEKGSELRVRIQFWFAVCGANNRRIEGRFSFFFYRKVICAVDDASVTDHRLLAHKAESR